MLSPIEEKRFRDLTVAAREYLKEKYKYYEKCDEIPEDEIGLDYQFFFYPEKDKVRVLVIMGDTKLFNLVNTLDREVKL